MGIFSEFFVVLRPWWRLGVFVFLRGISVKLRKMDASNRRYGIDWTGGIYHFFASERGSRARSDGSKIDADVLVEQAKG